MVCVSGLLGWVNPIHHSWYQLGSKLHLVQKVVSCACNFCHKAIQVGLVHWNRCAGVSGTLLHVGQRWLCSWEGLFPGDIFIGIHSWIIFLMHILLLVGADTWQVWWSPIQFDWEGCWSIWTCVWGSCGRVEVNCTHGCNLSVDIQWFSFEFWGAGRRLGELGEV